MSITSAILIFVGFGGVGGKTSADIGNFQFQLKGEWSFATHPLFIPDSDINVVSISKMLGKGDVMVDRVILSSKKSTTQSVSLMWHLSIPDGEGHFELLNGFTPLIPVFPASGKNGLGEDIYLYRVDQTLFSLREIATSLAGKGGSEELDGEFELFINVFEAHDQNGEVAFPWMPPILDDMISLSRDSALSFPCPDQACELNGGGYRCKESTGELCTNQAISCTSTLCGAIQIEGN